MLIFPAAAGGSIDATVTASASTSSVYALTAKNAGGTNLAWFRGDGPAYIRGPLVVSDSTSAVTNPTRHVYVEKVYVGDGVVNGQVVGFDALNTRMDFQANADNVANPNGVYGTLWYNSPRTNTGVGSAVRGNSYTIAQAGNAAVNVSFMSGLYGRARHEAAGVVGWANSLYADGAQNPGTGSITNAAAVYYNVGGNLSATNIFGFYTSQTPPQGTIASAPNTDVTTKVTGSGNIVLSVNGGANTLTFNNGGQLISTGTYYTTAQGNRFGSAAGSVSAPTITNTNLLLYAAGANNWAGMGSDSGGAIYVANGTSAPKTKVYFPPDDPADTETAMYLLTNRGGTVSLQRVYLGAADSGGSGKRALVVSN